MGEVSSLTKDKDTYGLIHGDISNGNYLNDGEKAHIIDFDEVEYNWFVSDIATPLFIDLRQARVLSALYRSRDFNSPDWSEWDEQARRFYYSNLLNNTPYIDMDFSRL